MKSKIHFNSLIVKLVITVITGSIALALLLSFVNISISKKVFVDSFAESQLKIFHQIDSEFYEFYSDMADIMAAVGSNEYVEQYFTNSEEDALADRNNRYQLFQSLKLSPIDDYSQVRVFMMGKDKKSYICNSSDIFAVSKETIWDSDVGRSAVANLGKIICVYRESGFTAVSKNMPVVVLAKAWSYDDNGQADMIAFITIKESDIGNMYSHFTSATSDIVLLNQDNEVVSCNNTAYLKPNSFLVKSLNMQVSAMIQDKTYQKEVRDTSGDKMYLMQQLQSSDYRIMGVINPDAAFKEQYDMLRLVWPTLGITAIVVLLICIFVNQQTKPIGTLAQTMRNSKQEQFKTQVPVTGTYEVRELAETYNYMVEELDKYIHQLIQMEADKRTAEIHALQMQINPHYMYNTLTSVKWLVWQGDTEKSTQVIDAFISLLRNVISNTDECVTVAQEIVNLENYVLVNQARYGDAVKVEFFVLPQCESYEIPKLILQPFVENAFFHAFPEGGGGTIQIFVKEERDNLRFDIVDNGVGIKTEQLIALNNKEKQKSEHFTGIGIDNVDDRIKLIYGMDYGINIRSLEGKGTTITLVLPKRLIM